MSQNRVRVSIPVFPECDPSIIYGVYDTLWAAGRSWDYIKGGTADGLFEPRLVAADDKPMKLFTGVSIIPQDAIRSVKDTDVVFVPNVLIGAAQTPSSLDRRLIDWIKSMHRQGAQLYASCGGSIVLAEAGLLEGQEATTHWAYAPVFRKYYPNVTLRIERILVQTGRAQDLYCGGGASSWQDLALLLVAKHGGTEEAIRMSKLFLYQWHRNGQLPYASMIQNVNHGDAVILHSAMDRGTLRPARHHCRACTGVGIAKTQFRPPIPCRHRLFASLVCSYASRRRGETAARNEHRGCGADRPRSRL
jgi:transcriptional regulator GlxA family with amidase domain